MPDYNSPENDNQSFVRWQQLTIDERGKSINLFLGMLFATLGFVISKLTDSDFSFSNDTSKWLILSGTSFNTLSIFLFILTILNRLKDFRITTRLAKISYIKQNGETDSLKRQATKAGEETHKLHRSALIIFGISEVLIVLGFIFQIAEKI